MVSAHAERAHCHVACVLPTFVGHPGRNFKQLSRRFGTSRVRACSTREWVVGEGNLEGYPQDQRFSPRDAPPVRLMRRGRVPCAPFAAEGGKEEGGLGKVGGGSHTLQTQKGSRRGAFSSPSPSPFEASFESSLRSPLSKVPSKPTSKHPFGGPVEAPDESPFETTFQAPLQSLPLRGDPKFALFLLPRHTFLSLFPLFGVFSWNFGGAWSARPSNVHVWGSRAVV